MFSVLLPAPSPLPFLSVFFEKERHRNFIEKMEGTGKTRIPSGALTGVGLQQRLPFSAGR